MRQLLKLLWIPALVVLVAACSGGGGATGGGSSTLSSIGGPVAGYPYTSAATVQGFAIEDGAQLAVGTLTPTSPGAAFTANLTPATLVPGTAFVNPLICNNLVVNPANAATTGVFILGVIDSGGFFGFLVNTTLSPTASAATTADKLYLYVLADRAATIRGICVEGGVSATYDMSLKAGWNRVEVSFNTIDGFGMPIATTFRVTESTANNTWVFADTTAIFSQGGPNPFFLELDRALRAPFAGE